MARRNRFIPWYKKINWDVAEMYAGYIVVAAACAVLLYNIVRH